MTTKGARLKKAFEASGIEVWGSGYDSLAEAAGTGWDLVISLNGKDMPVMTRVAIPRSLWSVLASVLALTARRSAHKTVKINWKDFGAPALPKAFWEALADDMRRAQMHRVLVFCDGGKGRTGTCLAILAGILGATDSDPVEYIRQKYTQAAVETSQQENYVERMTGITVRGGRSIEIYKPDEGEEEYPFLETPRNMNDPLDRRKR